jgi:hypothetical protein
MRASSGRGTWRLDLVPSRRLKSVGRDDRFQYEAAGSSAEIVGTTVNLAAELLLQPFPRGVPQLLVDVPEVSLDRVLGDEERLRNSPGGHAARGELGDAELAGGQCVAAGRRSLRFGLRGPSLPLIPYSISAL